MVRNCLVINVGITLLFQECCFVELIVEKVVDVGG